MATSLTLTTRKRVASILQQATRFYQTYLGDCSGDYLTQSGQPLGTDRHHKHATAYLRPPG
jgi:hypothetical protein